MFFNLVCFLDHVSCFHSYLFLCFILVHFILVFFLYHVCIPFPVSIFVLILIHLFLLVLKIKKKHSLTMFRNLQTLKPIISERFQIYSHFSHPISKSMVSTNLAFESCLLRQAYFSRIIILKLVSWESLIFPHRELSSPVIVRSQFLNIYSVPGLSLDHNNDIVCWCAYIEWTLFNHYSLHILFGIIKNSIQFSHQQVLCLFVVLTTIRMASQLSLFC